MQCESCGDSISLSTAYRENGNFVCPDCHADGQKQKSTATTPGQHRREERTPTPEETRRPSPVGKAPEAKARSTDAAPPRPTQQNFKTLLRLGKFISGTGWVVALLGVLTCLGGGALFSEGGLDAMAGVMALTVGMVISALGLLMAASGQQISCFVAIEHNTRSTYELIQAQQD
jgi:uncharacterized Zn finger protein (UPF0148 family)